MRWTIDPVISLAQVSVVDAEAIFDVAFQYPAIGAFDVVHQGSAHPDCATDGGDMINDLMPGNAGIARAAHSDRSWQRINDADGKFGCMPLRSRRTPLFLRHVASPVT